MKEEILYILCRALSLRMAYQWQLEPSLFSNIMKYWWHERERERKRERLRERERENEREIERERKREKKRKRERRASSS
jgi:hypothetical protein